MPSDRNSAFPWHQDSHYYNKAKTGQWEANTEHMQVVTVWITLVDANLGNGCLWVVPGSHKWRF